jgi:hypothetical protein
MSEQEQSERIWEEEGWMNPNDCSQRLGQKQMIVAIAYLL